MIACSALDDYLARALSPEQGALFDEHLPTCGECRAAVAGHERLAALLTAAVADEPIPFGLTNRVRGRVRTVRRRIGLVAASLAAGVAAVVWLHGRPADPIEPALPAPVEIAARPVEATRIFFPAGGVLAVREPTSSPNVTFLWVYPQVRTDAPRALEWSDQ